MQVTQDIEALISKTNSFIYLDTYADKCVIWNELPRNHLEYKIFWLIRAAESKLIFCL